MHLALRPDVPDRDPEGPNIGLIGSLATYGRINAFGFVETPYRRVKNGKVSDDVDYLTADAEDLFVIAQANAPLSDDNRFAEDRVSVRKRGGELELSAPTSSTTWTYCPGRWCRSRRP